MTKPHITLKKSIYTCEGDGMKRTGKTASGAHAEWEFAIGARKRKNEEDRRADMKTMIAALPVVPARTQPPFRPLTFTSTVFTHNAARARAAQPPMMGMTSNGRGWVEGGSSR